MDEDEFDKDSDDLGEEEEGAEEEEGDAPDIDVETTVMTLPPNHHTHRDTYSLTHLNPILFMFPFSVLTHLQLSCTHTPSLSP